MIRVAPLFTGGSNSLLSILVLDDWHLMRNILRLYPCNLANIPLILELRVIKLLQQGTLVLVLVTSHHNVHCRLTAIALILVLTKHVLHLLMERGVLTHIVLVMNRALSIFSNDEGVSLILLLQCVILNILVAIMDSMLLVLRFPHIDQR